jgi:uncharacterized protein
MHRLAKAQARRIAVRAQLLDAPRPTDLLAVVRQLTLLQLDPTAAIAPSADLVAWSRLGLPARAAQAGARAGPDAVRAQRARAADGRPRPVSRRGGGLASYDKQRVWLRDNDYFRRDILERLGSSGGR